MKTSDIISKIYASVGKNKDKPSFFSRIAKDDIQKIFEAQQSHNLDYSTSGFQPTNITSATVQKQIARMY